MAIIDSWMPAADTDQRLLDVHAYWTKLCRDGDIPRLEDFNPLRLSRLLEWVFLVDVQDEPRDFRFRVTGTGIDQAVSYSMTGKSIGEIFPPDFHGEVVQQWNAVLQERRTKWARGNLWDPERAFLKWQGMIMPLRGPDGNVTRLAGAVVFSSSPEVA